MQKQKEAVQELSEPFASWEKERWPEGRGGRKRSSLVICDGQREHRDGAVAMSEIAAQWAHEASDCCERAGHLEYSVASESAAVFCDRC